MIRKYVLPIIAVAGIIFAVVSVMRGSRPVPAALPVAAPALAPFASYVAGAGIVEASTENIAVGTPLAGVVTDIYVKIGDQVKAQAPLFKIDTRDLEAELIVRKASQVSAAANVKSVEAMLADAKNQWQLVESLGAGGAAAMSREETDKRRFAVQMNEGKLAQAQADVETAGAQVKSTEIEIERHTIRAPVDGQVMQVKIHLGEYAQTGVLATPLMLMGDVRILNVRTDIDENDAWRIKAGASAMAYLRGNRELKTPVRFVRFEPYVVPKQNLTGDSTERVDTRVLQVLYAFDHDALPVYVGQQMDVFVDAPPVAGPPTEDVAAVAAEARR